MEFRQIEAFINVVKYQSFSKAAKIMFLSRAHSQCPCGFAGTGIILRSV